MCHFAPHRIAPRHNRKLKLYTKFSTAHFHSKNGQGAHRHKGRLLIVTKKLIFIPKFTEIADTN